MEATACTNTLAGGPRLSIFHDKPEMAKFDEGFRSLKLRKVWHDFLPIGVAPLGCFKTETIPNVANACKGWKRLGEQLLLEDSYQCHVSVCSGIGMDVEA